MLMRLDENIIILIDDFEAAIANRVLSMQHH